MFMKISAILHKKRYWIPVWYDVPDGASLDVALTHKNYSEDAGASEQDFLVTLAWMDNFGVSAV